MFKNQSEKFVARKHKLPIIYLNGHERNLIKWFENINLELKTNIKQIKDLLTKGKPISVQFFS